MFKKLFALIVTLLWMALMMAKGHAQSDRNLDFIQQGMPYSDIRAELIRQHWDAVNNKKINASSLYAQTLYEQGFIEVSDCISMELDACWFIFKKGKTILNIKTITRSLSVESYVLKNAPK